LTIPIGWYPEYEGTHTSKSWMVGHTLVFLKNYCELLSRLIRKNIFDDFNAKSYNEINVDWVNLRDSYKTKWILNGLIDNKYKSAFIFGPPGTGKSTIAKAMAKKLEYNYVEIVPGQFLTEGEQKIVTTANFLFKRLKRMKRTVIFFDEVDQLVRLRNNDSESLSKWIVTSLLPEFQELHNMKDIKFFLATNNIDQVDHAMKRSGRIDFVLPMGPISWKDRLMELKSSIENNLQGEYQQAGEYLLNKLELKNLNLEELTLDNIYRKNVKFIVQYLKVSDYMLYTEISDLIEEFIKDAKNIKNTNDIKNKIGEFVDNYMLYKNIEDFERYINPQFCKFHNNSLILKEKKFVKIPLRMQDDDYLRSEYGDDIITNIIATNNFNPLLICRDMLSDPREIINKLLKNNYIKENELPELDKLSNLDSEELFEKSYKIKLAEILNNIILNNKDFYKLSPPNKIIGEIKECKKDKLDEDDITILNRLAIDTICENAIMKRDNWDILIKYNLKELEVKTQWSESL